MHPADWLFRSARQELRKVIDTRPSDCPFSSHHDIDLACPSPAIDAPRT
jgi:hypothetical protein